ncbi:MAG: citrate synthase [Proteobacteria bacterium]|nr:citrate synthase [Pseudomonadota bacterium]
MRRRRVAADRRSAYSAPQYPYKLHIIVKEFTAEYIPGLDGVPATKSAVSYLDGHKGILAYRGESIFDLVDRGISFEQCAHLLIYGVQADVGQVSDFHSSLLEHMRLPEAVIDVLESIPKTAHPMEALSIGVLTLAAHHNHNFSLNVRESSADEFDVHLTRQVLIYLGGVAALVAGWQRIRSGELPLLPKNDLSLAENFLYLFTGVDEISESTARVFDTCLILHAEHTINASTFASMVTASTLAKPGYVISAGINTLAGPLHGGANEKVVAMIDKIGSLDNVRPWLDEAMANKAIIWGMGHREYKVKDPRATILQKLIQQLYAGRKNETGDAFDVAVELERLCEERLASKGVYPNVDFYSGILYREMNIPTDQFTPIFAVSRTVGWLAHWIEQIKNNRIFRPTQIYTGRTVDG